MQLFIAFTSKIPVLALLVISATFTITGDVFAKYWSLNTRPLFFLLGVLFYSAGTIPFIPTLLREGLVVTAMIWSLISILGFIAVGIIIFKETLTTYQTIGAFLGIIALVLLVFPGK